MLPPKNSRIASPTTLSASPLPAWRSISACQASLIALQVLVAQQCPCHVKIQAAQPQHSHRALLCFERAELRRLLAAGQQQTALVRALAKLPQYPAVGFEARA